MKKYLILCLAAAGMVAWGCAKNDTDRQESAPAEEGRIVTVNVLADSFVTDSAPANVPTRVVSDNAGNFTWETGDAIGVWTGTKITEFTLSSAPGSASGTFTGTLTGTETIDENSYAVYPYGSITVDGTTININTGKGALGTGPTRFVPMFAKAGTGHTDGFAFKLLTAVAKVPIYNIPADAKWIFVETSADTPRNIFMSDTATASTTDATPVVNGGDHSEGWYMTLPYHAGIIDHLDFYIPLYPGSYSSNVQFKIKPQNAVGTWGNMTEYFRNGYFTDIATLNRKRLLVLPAIVYPAEVNVSATIEGGLSWKDGMTLNLYRSSTADVFTLDGSAIGQTTGTFTGTMTHLSRYAISSTGSTSLAVAGTTLTITNNADAYPVDYAMYGVPNESGVYEMKHLGATVHLTINNIPEATNYVFVECGGRSIFYASGTVDLSAETPVVTGTSARESLFFKVPDHIGDIAQLVVDLPILTGSFSNQAFGVELYEKAWDWGTKTASKQTSQTITTGGTINRGDVFNITYTF